MRKFPARSRHIVFAVVMAALMSFVISAAIPALNSGFPADRYLVEAEPGAPAT